MKKIDIRKEILDYIKSPLGMSQILIVITFIFILFVDWLHKINYITALTAVEWIMILIGVLSAEATMMVIELVLAFFKKHPLKKKLKSKPRVFEFLFFLCLFIATLASSYAISEYFSLGMSVSVLEKYTWFTAFYGIAIASGIYHYFFKLDINSEKESNNSPLKTVEKSIEYSTINRNLKNINSKGEIIVILVGGILFTLIAIYYAQIILPLTYILIILTYYYVVTTRKTMWYQALLDAKKDYRTPDMKNAVEKLWEFYRDCTKRGVDVGVEYKKIVNRQKSGISQGKMKDIDSLSYKRRLVTSFYLFLYDLWKHKILSQDMIFGYWHKDNLKIIPQLLKTIEIAQAEIQIEEEKAGEKRDEIDVLEITKKQMKKLEDMYDKCPLKVL